ncbi:MAG: hypothetical protein O2904_02370 [bacterium]|nr:hypothetical protein [bacterium]
MALSETFEAVDIDYEAMGFDLHRQARREVASRREYLSAVAGEITSRIQGMTEMSEGEEQATEIAEHYASIDTLRLLGIAMGHHRADMAAVLGDGSVRLFSDAPNLRGFYAGGSDIHMNEAGTGVMETGTYVHEAKHRSDGLPGNLDETLFTADEFQERLAEEIAERSDAFKEELQSASDDFMRGIGLQDDSGEDLVVIGDEAKTVDDIAYEVTIDEGHTARTVVEDRAIRAQPDAEGASYNRMYTQPSNRMRGLFSGNGESFDGAQQMVVAGNTGGFKDAYYKVLKRDAGIDLDAQFALN